MSFPLPKHIIIDGADGLGKTTICQMLGRKLQMPVVKMPNMKEYLDKGTPEEYSKMFNETIVQFADYDFILDRGFTSSQAYSSAFGRDFDLRYLDNIENILQPKVFILTGRRQNDIHYAGNQPTFHYQYFRTDESFNEEKVEIVDKEFANLAKRNGYTLIEVWGKSPQEVVDIIFRAVL